MAMKTDNPKTVDQMHGEELLFLMSVSHRLNGCKSNGDMARVVNEASAEVEDLLYLPRDWLTPASDEIMRSIFGRRKEG
jgi:hypothetical protein